MKSQRSGDSLAQPLASGIRDIKRRIKTSLTGKPEEENPRGNKSLAHGSTEANPPKVSSTLGLSHPKANPHEVKPVTKPGGRGHGPERCVIATPVRLGAGR